MSRSLVHFYKERRYTKMDKTYFIYSMTNVFMWIFYQNIYFSLFCNVSFFWGIPRFLILQFPVLSCWLISCWIWQHISTTVLHSNGLVSGFLYISEFVFAQCGSYPYDIQIRFLDPKTEWLFFRRCYHISIILIQRPPPPYYFSKQT